MDIPLTAEDASWDIYVRWRINAYRVLRKKITKVVHGMNFNVLVTFNWAYSFRYPELPPDETGFITGDIRPENQLFNASLNARYWTMLDKPFDVMNSGFLKWWGEWE